MSVTTQSVWNVGKYLLIGVICFGIGYGGSLINWINKPVPQVSVSVEGADNYQPGELAELTVKVTNEPSNFKSVYDWKVVGGNGEIFYRVIDKNTILFPVGIQPTTINVFMHGAYLDHGVLKTTGFIEKDIKVGNVPPGPGPGPLPPVPTTYNFFGPNSGSVNAQSGLFEIDMSSPYTGSVTITPNGGGLTEPINISWNNDSSPKTFSIIPKMAGKITLTPSNSSNLLNPPALSYDANAPPNPPPIPASGLRVLILYESSKLSTYPQTQLTAFSDKGLRDYLKSVVVVNPDTKVYEYRFWDKDTPLTGESDIWKNVMARQHPTMPWIVVSNGTTGFEGPLPQTVDDIKNLIKGYVK